MVRDFPAEGWEKLSLALSSLHKASGPLPIGCSNCCGLFKNCLLTSRQELSWSLSWSWFGFLALSAGVGRSGGKDRTIKNYSKLTSGPEASVSTRVGKRQGKFLSLLPRQICRLSCCLPMPDSSGDFQASRFFFFFFQFLGQQDYQQSSPLLSASNLQDSM